ncbi:MAG: HEAT repeat domain-containing protein [Planctomycetota bacterium]
MEKELQELQELRRKGSTNWEYWKFLIHSEVHRYALITHQQELIPALNYWSQMIPLIEQLQIEEEEIQDPISSRLLQMGSFAWEALSVALQHEFESVRKCCFALLMQQDLPKTQQTSLFSQILNDPSRQVRLTGLNAISIVTEISPEIFPSLLEMLSDPDFQIRTATAVALRNFQTLPLEGITGLRKALHDFDFSVRAEASITLGKLKAVEARIELLEIARNDITSIGRNAALWALDKIPKNGEEV